jgi:hypothetical protein
MSVEIPLTRGLVTLVDDADAESVQAFSWYASRARGGYYAKRTVRRPDGTRVHLGLHNFLTGWHLVDHRNRDSLDNRRANLRQVTPRQNAQNCGANRSNTSGFKGVSWYGRDETWRAAIQADGRRRHLGYFATPEAAAMAYDAAALQHFGEFAYLNFPKPTTTQATP